MVNISIASELCSVIKDFQASITMAELSERLYTITGIAPEDMRLTFESQGNIQNVISNVTEVSEIAPLLQYTSLQRIVVEDTNPRSIARQLTKSDDVPEFHLSELDYAKKQDTVLNWKIRNKLGRFDPEYKTALESARKKQQEHLERLEVGQRCSVRSVDRPERRGWLRYVGKVPEISTDDVWCGVEFDEPVGKNNGSFKDRVYFGPVCQNYGGFVRPANVETGDEFQPFPMDLGIAGVTDEDEV